jgi:hypothetical protein
VYLYTYMIESTAPRKIVPRKPAAYLVNASDLAYEVSRGLTSPSRVEVVWHGAVP